MKGMRPATQFLGCCVLAAGVASAQTPTIDLRASAGRVLIDGHVAGAALGASVHHGDVTGDFWSKELLLGTPGENGSRGAMRVLLRNRSSLADASVVLTGGAAGDRFGATADAGFVIHQEVPVVNGNPVPPLRPRDLVVGAPGAFGGRGAVYVFPGPLSSGTRTPADAVFTILGALPGDNLGANLETADLNNDGYREIVVSAPGRNLIYIVDVHNTVGTTLDLSVGSPLTIVTGLAGPPTITTGDLTGDGVFDLAIGDPAGIGTRGIVYLVTGRSGAFPATLNLPTEAQAYLVGADVGDLLGASLWVADIDDDGDPTGELIVGAPGGDGPGNGRPDAGEVHVLWGGPGLVSAFTPGLTFYGPAAGRRLGTLVNGGQITRRSAADLAMFAPGTGGAGEVFMYFGRHRWAFPDGPLDLAVSADRRVVVGDGPAVASLLVWEFTGEGAEEVLLGFPTVATAAGAGAGSIQIALSPRMDFSPGSLTFAASEGQSPSLPLQFANPSQIPIEWRATPSAAWIRVDTTQGSTSVAAPAALTVTADAESLAPGSHAGQISFRSMTSDLAMTLNVSVSLNITESRFVAIELPGAGADLAQPFDVRGWAIDTGVPSGTGVDHVEIHGYPDPGSGQPPLVFGSASYGSPRASVGSTYGARFTNSGFEFTSQGVPAGAYQLVVRARSSVTGASWSKPAGTVNVTVQRIASSDDVDGDGTTDLLWHNQSNGGLGVWLMDGHRLISTAPVTPGLVSPTWRLAAFQDFTGDGKRDLLWHNQSSGALGVWVMDGLSRTGTAALTPASISPLWQIAAAADFDGDGKIDLLWQHRDGWLGLWLMDGLAKREAVSLTPNYIAPAWKIAGVGDFNGDGKPDLVWRHAEGWIGVWIMNGAQYDHPLSIVPNWIHPDWRIASIADLNGDGKPDLIWHHQKLGSLGVWYLNGVERIGVQSLTPAIVSPVWLLAAPR
jgi:hypothetical protein